MFSLCGLNCSLCPMFIRGTCSGCIEGIFCYKSCNFAPCSIEHGDIEYCFECEEYPCNKYDGVELHDSLMSHRNQKKDMEKAKRLGIEYYRNEQRVKKEILNNILENYDDGHRNVFFCLAVNLLEIDDLYHVLDDFVKKSQNMDLKEKSDYLKQELINCAKEKNIELRLRK